MYTVHLTDDDIHVLVLAVVGLLGYLKTYLQAKTTEVKADSANTKSDVAISAAQSATTVAHAANSFVNTAQNTIDNNTTRLTKLENGGTIAIVNKVLSDKGITGTS